MKGALKSARSNPHRYWRARAVAAVADRLPKPVAGDTLRRALMDARPVADEYQRRAALVTLLPGLMRARCVGTAGAAARAIAKERSKQLLLFLACVGIVVGVIAGWLWLYNVMHVEVFSLGLLILLVIAAAGAVLLLLDLIGAVTLIAWARNRLHRLPPLPEPAEKGPLVEALGSALTIQDDGLRAKALSRVAKPLAMQEPAWLYPVWCETLHLSARRNRPGLLKDLCALRPVMRVLGGVGAIDALARAILDVGHQWP
jgi:hypothetical protein